MSLQGEAEAFFDAFTDAFVDFDGERIAQRYLVPYCAVSATNQSQVLKTHEEIAEYFQRYLDDYQSQGCHHCRYRDLVVFALNQDYAVATLTWDLLDQAGEPIKSWRESYNLCRVDGALRIFSSIDHPDPG